MVIIKESNHPTEKGCTHSLHPFSAPILCTLTYLLYCLSINLLPDLENSSAHAKARGNPSRACFALLYLQWTTTSFV